MISLGLATGLVLVIRRVRGERVERSSSRVAGPATVVFCVALPVAGAFGTDNQNMLFATVATSAGFGCLLLLGLAVLRRAQPNSAARSLVVLLPLPLLLAICVALMYHGTVIAPYSLPADLYHQEVPVQFGPLTGIRLDAGSQAFIESLHHVVSTRTNFAPGDRILALSDMPGAVFALDGVASGGVGFINYPVPPQFQKGNCIRLAQHARDVARTKLVLVNSPLTPAMRSCLPKLLPGFFGRLREVAEIPNPYGPRIGLDPVLKVYVLDGRPRG